VIQLPRTVAELDNASRKSHVASDPHLQKEKGKNQNKGNEISVGEALLSWDGISVHWQFVSRLVSREPLAQRSNQSTRTPHYLCCAIHSVLPRLLSSIQFTSSFNSP
jgi:hypothetical protein